MRIWPSRRKCVAASNPLRDPVVRELLVEIRAAHGREVSRLERECALLREQLLAMVGRAEASVQDRVLDAERGGEEPESPDEVDEREQRTATAIAESVREAMIRRADQLGVPVEALMDVPGFGE